MKKFYRISRFNHILSLTVFLSGLFTGNVIASNANLEVEIFVSCVEDLGNGKLLAYFGYDNPNESPVSVQSKKSFIAYNYTRDTKYVISAFEPGIHEKAFSQEFNSDDWVRWTVKFSNRDTKIVKADNTSEICMDELPIIPGYHPPLGGKEYNSKIGAELTSLYNAYDFDPANFTGATDAIFQIEASRVLIEVHAESGQFNAMMSSLSGLGFVSSTQDPQLDRATGWVEIGVLLQLNGFAALRYARPVYPGVSNYIVPATGLTKSQGDFAMHSDFARLGYDIDGSGFKIGVLSNSYDTQGKATTDVSNGDLPGAGNPNAYLTEVEVLKDIVPTHGALSDEGRAMLQIVHDIAPGAELAFRTGFLGEQDMADGIRELADAGSDVIVDDLSYITEPFFRDGVISQAIDSVVAEGVTFFSSAGNFGKASYTSFYNPETAPSTISGTAHDFSGTGDVFQAVLLPEGDYTLVMQWDDDSDASLNTTTTDLDIFLSDDAGSSLLGFNRENVGGFPIEVVPFSIIGDSVRANVVVARASGPDVPVRFKYILFRGGSQFQMLEYGEGGSSTIVGHPNAAGAISVGAVRFDKNPIYNPSEYPVPEIMSFSSIGGTPVDGVVRAKPDITAPNGVNTTVDLGNGDWDSPIDPDVLYPNFFGTSAASPHAAGVAALILEARYVFESDSSVTPEDIRTLLKSTAIDMDESGEDLVSGSGFIQAHKALMTFANPSPEVENLILASESGLPGEEITPFSFTITGDFFNDSTQVLFRGEALEEGVLVVDEGTITVDHEGFIGNPEVQVYNPPISSGEQDGGVSEEIYFSDPVKQKVLITADDLSKKYGEVLPAYTASFLLVTVDDDTLTFEEAVADSVMLQAEADRLSGLAFSGPANDTSDANQYVIEPVLSPELFTDVLLEEVDHAITEKYILEFVNGNLNVEKLALTITPEDMDMVYGQQLPAGGFDFIYELGDSGVVIENPGLILSGIEQEHTDALTNEIALVRGVALVNGIPVIRGTALVNGVKMIRGTALVNGVEVNVEVAGSDTTVFVAGVPVANGATLVRGIALVNDRPFVSMTEIRRGVALVNGDQVTFENGYMTALNGDSTLVNGSVPAIRGIALVNGLNGLRGVALVNGHEVVIENGTTTIDGQSVPGEGIALINGIPVVRGVALVNGSLISRGLALVNGLDVPIENGIPRLRGTALVNGIPLRRGTALVNNLEVHVLDGEVSQVFENGVLVNGLSMSRGVALVNGIALVNGSIMSRGTALVNGLVLPNTAGPGEDVVNLEDMNFMASGTALLNGSLPSVRGVALVNDIEGVEGEALLDAVGTPQEDGTIVYENVITRRGIALVNGLAYVRGTALVNGGPIGTRGTALVNGSTINESSNSGTIMVFDATDIGDTTENVSFSPISFITGTMAGQHWIVPGTFVSNNFEISYGLGKLTIDPADLSITAEDKSKTYGEADPALTYTDSGLFVGDTITGNLMREAGEDAGSYHILQGSVTAGENYAIAYDTASLTINPAALAIAISATDKVYDGTREAEVSLTDNRLSEDSLVFSYTSALFADKHVGFGKEVRVLGIQVGGTDAGNYEANTEAADTATIASKDLHIEITADDKIYDGTDLASTTAFVESGQVVGDSLTVSSSNGMFVDKNVGTGKGLTADVSVSGPDAGNYAANTTADTTASISARELVIGIAADDKTYDGTDTAATAAFVESGLVGGDALRVSSSGGFFDSKDAGSARTVTATVSTSGTDAGNYLANTIADTTASIVPKEVDVTPIDSFLFIREGDPLPEFAFHYLGWIDGDTGNEGYTVVRDTDGIQYDATSNESAGSYTVTPEPFNSNYTFAMESGVLHVNPYGPGTRAVKPVLNCIRELSPGYYMANFEYKNENGTAVYIPFGGNNMLTGSGIDWENSQEVPTMFEPGGGEFVVFFDGSELSWTVNSRDGNQKVSNAANANSNSTKCKGNSKKAATVSGDLVEEDNMASNELLAYPNPVVNKVHLSMKGIENYTLVQLYDFSGRSFPITSIDKRTDHLEIDMEQLSAGHYFIRIVMEDSSRVVQLVKQ